MSDGRTYEMLWDCQFCGTRKLLGKTHRHCPNCGAPQDPNARYFPSDDEKVAVEDHVFVGADLICDNCGALSAGNAEFCGNCGAPLTDAARAKTLASETRAEGGAFAQSGSGDVIQKSFDAEMERVGVKPKAGGFDKRTLAVIAVIAVVVIGIIAALTITREAEVAATGFSWNYEIKIDEYRNFRVSTWRSARPGGDNVQIVAGSCESRVKQEARRDCRTIRTDNGDGTFSERESCNNIPEIREDWCTFTGQRWEFDRSIPTSGTNRSEPAPYWGEYTLACEGQRVGCERVAERNETYILYLQGEDKTYECPVDRALWDGAEVGYRYSVQVRVVDAGAADCGTLELLTE